MSLTEAQLEERRKQNQEETEQALKLAAEQKERDRLAGKLPGVAGLVEDLAKSVKGKLENGDIKPSLPEHMPEARVRGAGEAVPPMPEPAAPVEPPPAV